MRIYSCFVVSKRTASRPAVQTLGLVSTSENNFQISLKMRDLELLERAKLPGP